MKALRIVLVVWLIGLTQGVSAEAPTILDLVDEAKTHNLAEYKWIKRPVVIFADNPADPRYIEQMEWITAGLHDLVDRDVVVLVDTDPATQTPLRQKLRPRGFMLVLLGKDGGILLRKPTPWTVRELSRVIDKSFDRQEEIRARRGRE